MFELAASGNLGAPLGHALAAFGSLTVEGKKFLERLRSTRPTEIDVLIDPARAKSYIRRDLTWPRLSQQEIEATARFVNLYAQLSHTERQFLQDHVTGQRPTRIAYQFPGAERNTTEEYYKSGRIKARHQSEHVIGGRVEFYYD